MNIQKLNPYQEVCKMMAANPRMGIHLSIRVSKEDYHLFNTVCPEWGAKQTVLGQLFKHIITTLKENGIDTPNSTAMLRLVNIMCGRAPKESLTEGLDRDDAG